MPRFTHAEHRFLLAPPEHAALRALAEREGATLFDLLLAAFALLLHRRAGADDLSIATDLATLGDVDAGVRATAERTAPPSRLVLLRIPIEVAFTIRAWMGHARAIREAAHARDEGATPPAVQTRLVLGERANAQEGDRSLELHLAFHPSAEGLEGTLGYATELFDPSTAARMTSELRQILRAFLADPDAPIAAIDLLDPEERRRLLVTWNDTAMPFPDELCVHQLFLRQVDRAGDALAILDGDERVTYARLEAWSNAIAHRLRAQGAGPGTLVGVALGRSAALVASLLGVLGAGAAYVPLDPSYPTARLAQIAQQARLERVISDRASRSVLPAIEHHTSAEEPAAGEPTHRPEARGGARDLSYVLFTSGSTGAPKGVAIEHRSAVAFLAWARSIFTNDELARVLFCTSIAFDLSVFELFLPLSTGGALVVAESALDLAKLPPSTEVTLVNTVPSAMAELVRMGALPPSVRTVCLAGEPLSAQLAAAIHALPHAPRLYNLYGPTESTTYATFTCVPRDGSAPTLGRPIANTRAYVLDEARCPVPIGVAGEIYLGGAGLARGYLHQPELTAERFVPSPFVPGDRLYRTGDRGRFRADGQLIYLGRLDHQVKIRGFRVELGEIESVLRAHPFVREAVVICREDTPGDPRLVAYVVPSEAARPPDDAASAILRETIEAALPHYMVPSAIVLLSALPLTPNGKVDRNALPAPAPTRPARAALHTEMEELLAGLWAELLHVDHLGPDDHFFLLGGHSLSGTRLLARLAALLDVDLPLAALFEAPTLARFAARVDDARERTRGAALPPLRPRDPSTRVPLSPGQERLWLFDQLEPNSRVYTMPLVLRLDGPLDVSALEQSLALIVRRHEALRTTFVLDGSDPRQHIAPPSPTPLSIRRLDGEPAIERAIAEELDRPFDLAKGPLFRALLLQAGELRSVLVLTMHHIVSDGWSLRVLLEELGTAYEAITAGGHPELPPLPVQLADHALWQRETLGDARIAAQRAHVRAALEGAPPTLALPLDHPRPPAESHRGKTFLFPFPAALSDALLALGRREGVTPFITLLSAFALLLQRWTGEDDVVIGSALSGRSRVEIEPLIGFFVKTPVLRARLEGDPTFVELLGRMRDVTLGAFANQDLPFELLLEDLAPTRDLAHSPVFQVMFVLQSKAFVPASLGQARCSPIVVDTGIAHVDLTLFVHETDEGFTGALEYASDLFEPSTITRLAGHLLTLLHAIVEDPRAQVSALRLMTPEERRALAAFNATARPYPRDASIPSLVARWAEERPEAVALRLGDDALSRGELQRRARALAHRLVHAGVAPGSVVALLLPRSFTSIVAMLAVLEAGGAYLALDPTLPPARLAWLLRDAGVRLALTHGTLPSALLSDGLALDGIEQLDLTGEAEPVAHADARPLAPRASGTSLAALFYTSGSTGAPKAVSVLHRGIVRLVTNTDYARFAPDEVFLHVAPSSFDASSFEIWGALLNGAELALSPTDKPSIDDLDALLRRHRVTTLWLTAALFNLVIDTRPRLLATLHQLLIGGEALSVPHVEKALALLPGVALINGYGPTENTTFSCCHRIREARGLSSIPIGRPIANSSAHVLDAHGEPLPLGFPGELHVGGDGVAAGYFGRPELTDARFWPDPFCAEPGARLYRTGDRVRRLGDGSLEFLGRLDEQIKLRGYRIEPGEIEAALSAHPGVSATRVLARRGADATARLLGYFIPRGEAPSPEALRSHLARTLPDYMIPADFVALSAFPLTRHGKIDLAALPDPTHAPRRGPPARLPKSALEALILALFRELLGNATADIDDDFFLLGGHSLLATRLLARLATRVGIELPLRTLFEAKSPARLAARIEELVAGGAARARPPLTPAPASESWPLSFAQQRLWLIDQLEPGSTAYLIPLGLCLRGALDLPALARSLGAIVERHEALRTVFPLRNGEPEQVIRPPALTLHEVDLRGAPEPELAARELARRDAQTPMNLAEGPLFRATIARLGEAHWHLLLTMHHIVADAWSLGVLSDELGRLYEAALGGAPTSLAPLPVRYTDVAQWQRAWLSGERLAEQSAMWRRALLGAPPLLELPSAHARPSARSYEGHLHEATLRPDLTRALDALCRREGVTRFMLLLAAYQLLLGRTTGQVDIVVASPIAGRTAAETQGMIGFFLNTLALRATLDGQASFRALLAQVRETTVNAYSHQDLPFEAIIDALGLPRELGQAPLAQAYFNLVELAPLTPSLAGLTTTRLDPTTVVAKLDIDLHAEAQGETLRLSLIPRRDLFDHEQGRVMLAHLIELLEQVIADPDRPVSTLPLTHPIALPPRAQRVKGASRPGFVGLAEGARDQGLSAAFRQVVERQPDAVALDTGTEQIRYRDLDQRAEALAARLARALEEGRRGGPERGGERVGLLFPHGAAMIVALLGALRAGAMYVPLDPSLPEGRLAFQVDDAGLAALLCDEALLAKARSLAPPGCALLSLDASAAESPLEPFAHPRIDGSLPAYLLYTSGSTGQPKGVLQCHRNVLQHVGTYIERLQLDEGDRLSLVASYAFDAAVMDVFGALLSGATLVPIDLRSPAASRLPSLLRELRISVFHATPTVFRHLGAMLGEKEQLEGVRLVVLGGEEAKTRDVQSFRAHFPRQSLLVNGLGPTECTLALQYFIDEATVIDQATVPVGYPVEGVRIRLVTPLGEQVAPWGTGQVEIESSALALGYWKRPELTAKAFLPGPAGQETRVYRTGDLGRMRPDGAIEYLGRIDHQVKVRGHRIELGEIEAAILASGEVAEVVVALRASSSGEERLTAYLVPLPGRSPALEALRKALALTLPSVMIPSSFLVLPALPLLPNGKVALRALPSPAPRSAEAGAPARDDLEAQIEAMFRALLGVDRIGPNESFFDLGGHSMLAVTLIEQLHRRFGVRLSLLSLFEAQTVEALAALLRKGGAPPRDHVLVPIRALGRLRPLFLISRPNVNSLGYLALARALDPARPVFGLQRECPEEHELGRPFLHEEYRAWAQAYLTTIRAVQPKGPHLLGGMCEGALIAFTMTRLLEAEGEEVALLAMFDAWPEENTRRHLLHQVFLYQKSLRESLDEGLPTLARRLVHKAARALRRGRLDDEAAANRALWNERIFPGPDFVPPRVNAPIAVFAVDEQPYWRVRDESLGWASRTHAPVRIHRVEGDHRTLLRDPHVASLARALDAELRRADEASPRRSDGSAPSPHEGPGSPGPPPTVITTVNDLRRALT